MLEEWLRTSCDKVPPVLTAAVGANNAADLLTSLLITGVRLFFAKKLTTATLWTLPKGFATGKPNKEKLNTLLEAWARHVQSKHPDSTLLTSLGFKPEADLAMEEVTFDCSPEKAAPPSSSSGHKFQTNDIVALLRRCSWPCPTKANVDHRKDIVVGTELKVVGHDTTTGTPLVQATVQDNGAPRILVHTVKNADLQLFSEYLKEKNLSAGEPETKTNLGAEKPLTPKGFGWVNEHLTPEERTSVSVVEWRKLLSQGSKADLLVDMQGEATFLMNLLKRAVPQFTEKDLVVVHRSSKQIDAPHAVEVWTARKFAPFELVLAPYSHEIKGRFWTKQRAVMVRTSASTKTLLGQKTLAIDGRVRADFVEPPAAQQGEKQKERRMGSLFFCIQRTSDKKKANLILTYTKPQLKMELPLPGKKKLEKSDLSDLMEIPLLSNPAVLPAHTLLVAMDDLALNEIAMQESLKNAKRVADQAKAGAKKQRTSDENA